MLEADQLVALLFDHAKKLFFPEEWVSLDAKFSKLELFTLIFIDKKRECTMSELVEYINSPMSTATGIADRLVKNGYAQRDRSDTDRRAVLLRLTPEGERLVQSLKDTIGRYLNLALEGISEEEIETLTRIALKVLKNLQAHALAGKPEESAKEEIKEIRIE